MTQLQFERLQNSVVVRLPTDLCFYEKRAEGFVEELVRLAEESHQADKTRVKGVLLLQTSRSVDFVASWFDELQNSCLFAELVHRIDTWRWLLSLVRNSPVPWIYAAAADCQGSAWELALSCQRRFFFATEALLGFPEIEAGAFPPGGVLESLSKRAGRAREKWQAKPLMNAIDALEDGLLHGCAGADAWMSEARNLFERLLRAHPTLGVRDQRIKRSRETTVRIDFESRQAAYEQLGSVWRHEHAGSQKEPTAWDYCWQLVLERAKLKQPGNLGRLICLIASRQLLSPAYSAWLSAELVRRAAGDFQHRSNESGLEQDSQDGWFWPVVIDLNDQLPPTLILHRLLTKGRSIAFFARDSRSLQNSLNLLVSRLERLFGMEAIEPLWRSTVSWFQGIPDSRRSICLRFSIDDQCVVSWPGGVVNFFRLSGNLGSSSPGLLEWQGRDVKALPSFLWRLFGDLADDLVTTRPTFGSSLAGQVRGLFFEEMLRVSAHCDSDLSEVTSVLRVAGWRFAGDEENWDRFLKVRPDPKQSLKADLNAASHSSLYELGSWKQAKAVAKKQNPKLRWDGTTVSLHLATWLGLATWALSQSTEVCKQEITDYLCKEALGLPPALGSPLTFLRQRGSRRVESYALEHWPNWPRSWGSFDRGIDDAGTNLQAQTQRPNPLD